ncbi:MAG: hypothetical protein HY905_10220 [Deltaproteobacteria bacterium]|nr:hypothetical protein [Deltaproteobacteria bacterium]
MVRSLRPPCRSIAPVAALCIAAWCRAASANFAPQDFGDPAGEPAVAEWAADVSVEHEWLRIDLRPLEDEEDARVEVRYRVRVSHEVPFAEMVFASPGVEKGAVTLDGRTVGSTSVWRVYDTWRLTGEPMPTIDGGQHPFHVGARFSVPNRESGGSGSTGALHFTARLTAGVHELAVEYRVSPMDYQGVGFFPQQDVVYLLSPARSWAGFGRLDVVVELPEDWDAVSVPALARRGDTLVGEFDGIPRDELLVGTRRPAPWWAFLVAGFPWFIAALGLGSGFWGGLRSGRQLAIGRFAARWVVVTLLAVAAPLLGIATFAVALGGTMLGSFIATPGWMAVYGGGMLSQGVVAVPLAVVACALVGGTLGFLRGRRLVRSGPAVAGDEGSAAAESDSLKWAATLALPGALLGNLVLVNHSSYDGMLWSVAAALIGGGALGILLGRLARRSDNPRGRLERFFWALGAGAGVLLGLPLLVALFEGRGLNPSIGPAAAAVLAALG